MLDRSFLYICFLFFSFFSKDYRFSFLLPYSFSRFINYSLSTVALVDKAFRLYVKFLCSLVYCSFSRLSRFSTIVFPSLSLNRFSIYFSFCHRLFLWFANIFSLLFCYRFICCLSFTHISHVPKFIRYFPHTLSYQSALVCS